MMSDILAALAIGSLVAMGALPAQADTDFSQCHLPARMAMTKNLADIPSPVLAQLPGLGGTHDTILSDADDPSDPINDNVPSVRLAGAFSEGARWAVVYENGDFANSRTMALFSVAQGKASLIRQQTGPVCAILKAAFPD